MVPRSVACTVGQLGPPPQVDAAIWTSFIASPPSLTGCRSHMDYAGLTAGPSRWRCRIAPRRSMSPANKDLLLGDDPGCFNKRGPQPRNKVGPRTTAPP